MVTKVFGAAHVVDHFGPAKPDLAAKDLSAHFSSQRQALTRPGISFTGTPMQHVNAMGTTLTHMGKNVALDAVATVAQLLPLPNNTALTALQDKKMTEMAGLAEKTRQAVANLVNASPSEWVSSLFGQPLQEKLGSIWEGAKERYARGIEISPRESAILTAGTLMAGASLVTKNSGGNLSFLANVKTKGNVAKFSVESGGEVIKARTRNGVLTTSLKGNETEGLFDALNVAVRANGVEVRQLNLNVPLTHPVVQKAAMQGQVGDLFTDVFRGDIVRDYGNAVVRTNGMELEHGFMPPIFAMGVNQAALTEPLSKLLPKAAQLHAVPRFDPTKGNVSLVFKKPDGLGLVGELNSLENISRSANNSAYNIMEILEKIY